MGKEETGARVSFWKKKVHPAVAYPLLAVEVIAFIVLIGIFFW